MGIAVKRSSFRSKKITNSQMMLIDFVYKQFGGVKRVSVLTCMRMQRLVNWRLRGGVPLMHCGTVARRLNLDPNKTINVIREALNWEDHYRLFGYGSDWEELVKAFKFPKEIERKILKAKHPKRPKL